MAVNMSIASLKDKISAAGGLQRNNRFYVSFNGPVAPFADENGSELSTDRTPKNYIAETVLFPSVTMTTQADGLAGPGLGRTSPRGLYYKDGLLMTFPVFGNWKLVEGIETWIKSLYYQNSGSPQVWITEYYDTPQNFTQSIKNSSLAVNVLDLNGDVKAVYNFTEVFPVEIVPLQLSTMTTNEYLKLTVRFAFRNYTLEIR